MYGNVSNGSACYYLNMKCRRRINRAALGLLLASLVVWLATGRAIYTRFPDARRTALEPLQHQDGKLWPGTGERDVEALAATRAEEFPNRFMLGLLPSGGGKYLLSVGGVALIFGVAVLATWAWQSIPSKRSCVRAK